jgi:hypothetical protein
LPGHALRAALHGRVQSRVPQIFNLVLAGTQAQGARRPGCSPSSASPCVTSRACAAAAERLRRTASAAARAAHRPRRATSSSSAPTACRRSSTASCAALAAWSQPSTTSPCAGVRCQPQRRAARGLPRAPRDRHPAPARGARWLVGRCGPRWRQHRRRPSPDASRPGSPAARPRRCRRPRSAASRRQQVSLFFAAEDAPPPCARASGRRQCPRRACGRPRAAARRRRAAPQ